jgi:hypothetical protein
MILDNATRGYSNQSRHRSFSCKLYVHLCKLKQTVGNMCDNMFKSWTMEDVATANVLAGLGFDRRQIRMGVQLQKALQKPVTCAAIAMVIKKTPQHCSPKVKAKYNIPTPTFNSFRQIQSFSWGWIPPKVFQTVIQMDAEAVRRYNWVHHCTTQVPSYFVVPQASSHPTLATNQNYYRFQGTLVVNNVSGCLIKKKYSPRP